LLSQRNGIPLPERTIRSWIKQALTALAAIHAAGYVHRDVKPENLLVNKESTLKIADFGLARSITPNPEIQNNTLLTDYVSTRWYRAPEVLLPGCSESGQYGTAIDLYALGTVAAELYTSYPLLPGTSEADQLHCICAVFGPPTEETWAEGLRRAEGCGFTFHKLYTEGGSGRIERLSLLIPTASQHALALIASLCQWDPAKRPTALEALQHPYFQEGREWDLQESVLNPLIAAKVNRWLEAAAQKLADHNNPNVSKHVPRPSIGKLVSRAIRRQVNTLNAYHERRQRLPVL
jgi:protein kinase